MSVKNNNVFLAKSLPQQSIKEHARRVLKNVEELENNIKLNIKNKDLFWKYLKLSAYMHDMGKFYEGFQKFIKRELDNKSQYPGYNMHSLLSPLFFDWTKIGKEENNKQNNDYIFWRKIVLSSIVFHHYRQDIIAVLWGNDREKWEKIVSEVGKDLKDKLENIKEIVNDELKDYLIERIDNINKTARFFEYIIPPETPLLLPEQVRNNEKWNDEWKKRYILMKGFLMRADHIASNIGDVVIEKGGTIDFDTVKDKIKERINKDEKEIWQIDKARDTKDKSIILIGSTGIGKTEFAFLWGAGEKIIFTLPMRTMVDQTYNRAKDIFGSDNVGFIHSSSMLKLLDEKDDIEEIELIRSQSQNLSYPFIAATGDQIFTIAFKYPGYEKILSTLSYSRLVIDEVQAYDPIATAAIVKAIEEVYKLGGKFLLMTATFPKYVKKEITERIERDYRGIVKCNKEGENDITKHNIYMKVLDNRNRLPKSGYDRKGKMKCRKYNGLDIERFYEQIIEIINGDIDRNYLIIVNTVNNAQVLYKKTKEEYSNDFDVLLLHSRMLFEDREKVLEKIQNVNKNGNNERVILITTQIVEASIDIDFDILITEIAPLESLIQRMGRVNRNRGKYEEGKGDVYILYPWLENTGRIYECDILVDTYDVIRGFIGNNDENGRKISEQQKQELLRGYYQKESMKRVKDKFEKTLKILDNLYVAENKAEAHRMFRDISSVNVIPENKLNELKDEVKGIINEELKNSNLKGELLKNIEKEEKKLVGINLERFERLVKRINEWMLSGGEKIDPEEVKNQEQFYLNYLNIIKVLKMKILGEMQKYSISLHYWSAVGNIEPLELNLPKELRGLTKGFYVIKSKYTYEEGKGLIRDDNYETKESGTLPNILNDTDSSNIL